MEFERICMNIGVPCTTIGRVTNTGRLIFNDMIDISTVELKNIYKNVLERKSKKVGIQLKFFKNRKSKSCISIEIVPKKSTRIFFRPQLQINFSPTSINLFAKFWYLEKAHWNPWGAKSIGANVLVCNRKKSSVRWHLGPEKIPLELVKCSENCRGVVGTCVANDTMLWRSAQLLLTAENHHFEGSMHLKAKTAEGFWYDFDRI